MIKALAEEFFAGEGASRTVRTLFAVGDEKQSIFSFQGAVPAWFSRMQRELGDRARRAGYAWSDLELHLSFRSVPIVLAAVDTVFALADGASRPHRRARSDRCTPRARRERPGRVVALADDRAAGEDRAGGLGEPVDHLGEKSPEVQLANRIADTIRGWLRRRGAARSRPASRSGPATS